MLEFKIGWGLYGLNPCGLSGRIVGGISEAYVGSVECLLGWLACAHVPCPLLRLLIVAVWVAAWFICLCITLVCDIYCTPCFYMGLSMCLVLF